MILKSGSSGSWQMYFFSIGAQGHATSFWPFFRGAPTECRHGTNSAPFSIASRTFVPTRVMISMLTTT